MRGLNCRKCKHAGPYVTAYEIALKHGFNGTEAEWIKSIGTVWVVKALTQASGTPGTWTCDTTFAEMAELAGDREIHLLTTDGKIAVLTGMSDDEIVFCTQPYQNDGKDYYDFFAIDDDNDCVWGTKRFLPASGEVTKSMLTAGVQTSLGKADTAYQKPGSGISSSDMTSEVQTSLAKADTAVQEVPIEVLVIETSYYDGDYYTSKTPAEVYEAMQETEGLVVVLIDRYGRQCIMVAPPESAEDSTMTFFAYDASTDWDLTIHSVNSSGIMTTTHKKIPTKVSDLENDSGFIVMPSKRLIMTESSGTFTVSSMDFPDDTSVEDIMTMAIAGMVVQLMNSTTGDAYRLCHVEGTGNSAILGFEGVTYTSGTLYHDLFVVDHSFDITRILHQSLS